MIDFSTLIQFAFLGFGVEKLVNSGASGLGVFVNCTNKLPKVVLPQSYGMGEAGSTHKVALGRSPHTLTKNADWTSCDIPLCIFLKQCLTNAARFSINY